MRAASHVLQFISAGALCLTGLLALRDALGRRTGAPLAFPAAIGLLGVTAACGVVNVVTRYRYPILAKVSLVTLIGSGLALVILRHRFIPLSARALRVATAGNLAVAVLGFAVHLPVGENPELSPFQYVVVSLVILAWCASVGEPAYRFWVASRDRPVVQRTRLRALALGYGGYIIILLAAIASAPAAGGRRLGFRIFFQTLSLLVTPLLYVSVVPPSWLRRIWRRRQENALVRGTENLLAYSPNRPTLAGRALFWATRIAGADAGAVVDADGAVLATCGPARPQPSNTDIALPLPTGAGEGTLLLRMGPLSPLFGSDEMNELRRFGADFAVALDRVRLQEALAEQTVTTETMLRAMSDLGQGFVVSNAGRAEYVNDAYCRMTGYSREELMALESLTELAPAVDREAIENRLHRRLAHETVPDHFEAALIRKDGSRVEVEAAVKLLESEAGTRIIAIVRDITRRKQAEEIKTSFLNAVSHELRTPLTSVLGFAQTVLNHGEALPLEERRELIRKISVNAQKLERLLTDLLDLDRLARGILEPSCRPTDLRLLVARVAAESVIDHAHPVTFDLEPVVASVDPAKVERIVENLLANASRYTPPGTPIWIRLAAAEGGVLIAVEDAGPGLPAELRRTIFEPFRQGPGVANHSPGVGIGLSLVARFAELHGGRAWVEERPGGGASFRVFFPARRSPGDYSSATLTTPSSTTVS